MLTDIVNVTSGSSFALEGLLAVATPRASMQLNSTPFTQRSYAVEPSSNLCLRTAIEFSEKSNDPSSRWFIASEHRKDVILELLMLHFEAASFTTTRMNASLAYRYGAEAPRLISQVRKERQRLSSSYSTDSLLEDEVVDGRLDHGRADAFLIAQAMAHNVVIMCYLWRRDGTYEGLTVSMVRLPWPSLLSVKAPSGLETLDSAIVCTLHHPKELDLKNHASVVFGVKLLLRSYYHAPIQYTVEALDTIKESDLNPNGRQVVIADGLRWVGKTSYLSAPLEAYGSSELEFTASVSTEGTYDLRRLKVILSSEDEGAVLKRVQAVSIVRVTRTVN